MTQATISNLAPAETASRPRSGRPGRAVGVLATAVLIAVVTYAVGPLTGPGGADVAGSALLPVPGDMAPLAGGSSVAGATVDGRLPIAERLAFWAGRVAATPADYLSLVQLALVKAEAARLTSDLDGFERALGDIDHSLAIVPAYPPTIRARASIRYALHDFAGALADARAVLAAAPDDPTALAVSGDALIELGRPDEAATAYERLAGLAPGPWLDVRLARLASTTGDSDRALSLARKAFYSAPSLDPEEVAFYAYAVGEYGRLAGDVDAARAGFETALAERPTDVAALLGLARIDAFDERAAEAIAGLRDAAEVVPQPETLALLGDLLEATGDPRAAEAAFETVRFIGELGSIQSAVYDRPLIRFELDHRGASAETLAAARASLAARSDAAGHDLVAWALYRLGRFDEAAAEIIEARALGADDARLRLHDGAIALARGDRGGGIALLQGALADGPALDPVERAEAIRLAR